jgi:chromosome segregation ATPase
MQILESKQQLLDSTKKTYVGTESRVKQLKDEAMAARKELDDLKRREHTIEKECHTIQLQKEKQLQQQKQLEQSVAQSQAEFDKEIQALQLELASVKQQGQNIQSKDVTTEVKQLVEKQAKERAELLKDFEKVQREIQQNNQQFVDQVKQKLTELLAQLPQEASLEVEVNNCKEDVHTLVARIKSTASVQINE